MKIKNRFGLLILIAILSFSSLVARAAVWVEKENWSSEWEDKFSKWVKFEFDEDFFTSGKYKGIPTDCADAVYFSRLVFAAENKLPFAIKDPTGGPNKITNKMSRFDNIKDADQRLRKFMLYVAGVVGTKSLPSDTYPVKVDRQNVRPGTVWSRPRIKTENVLNVIFGGDVKEDPGHAEVVRDVNDNGVIEVIGSTVPAAVRKLQATTSLVFLPVETSTGLRRWMWPDQYSKKQAELPGFSLEQFSMGILNEDVGVEQGADVRTLDNWLIQVKRRLRTAYESRPEALKRITKDLCTMTTSRIDLVKNSENFKRKTNNACMNAANYDSYSTPSRDKRIWSTLENAVEMAEASGFSMKSKMKSVEAYLKSCELEIQAGKKILLWDFLMAMASDDVSSNPNDNFESRWGLEGGKKSSCPKY